nr:tyrosine-protein phosphatase 99A [Leptinotarsa decemlineata]
MRMGHAFVYVFVAVCGIIAQNTTTEYYTTLNYTLGYEFKKNTQVTDTPTTIISDAVPGKPRNLTILDFTSISIYLQWANPEKKNGVIEGYRVYYMNNNFTEVQPDKIPYDEPLIRYNLTRLKPHTEYTIFVKAFTLKHEGYPSESVIATTDISGPSAPNVFNVTCLANETIHIQWERPANFHYSIDYYYLYIYLGNRLYHNITIPTSKENLETTYVLKNVTPNANYKVQIQASSISNRTHRLIMGPMLASHVYTSPISDKTIPTSELSAGIIAGVLCAVLALLVAGLAFLVWRKCFRAPYYYLDNPQCSAAALDWNTTPEPDADHNGPIPVALFARHVQELHADGDIGFSKEYEAIQNDAVNEISSSEHSQHPENKPKNRYLNIIAYDHSRVHLLTMRGQKISTYINANYIDGFQMNRAYIGTQGPLPSTFDCFWRMVWEQRVTIIVMITNLVERGRRKCDMYWPKEGTETYGVIQVKLVKEDIMATYIVRTLSIRHLRVNIKNRKKASLAEKTVYQYHYTNWPDHGTPDHPLPVIHFVKKSSAANPADAGPIVVHCSAGVGRTGTYIVLDAMLRQIRARGEVNIFGFLKHIRAQRNFLVQTEEQYIFIHDALVEAIECGETNICREKFPRYVSVLQNLNLEDKNELWKPLDVQFRLVTSFVCRDFNLVSANKPINLPKNRCAVILPVESARVHLTPKPGEDGSDYINASWLQGFHNLREFIITQHPFKHTVQDFWQMVWDHSAQLIVMISFIDNSEYEIFWPAGEEVIETDTYTCKQTNENGNSAYYTREFLMRSVQDDYEIPVKMVHCFNWPHQVGSLAEMYHLPNFILDMQKIQNGPIIVVDRFGGTEAATFCALTTLKKHLIYDNKVDVYMYAKLYHNKRPGIWISSDDYMKLHLCVQTLCNPPEPQIQEVTPDLYAMANGTINNGSISTDCIRVPPEGMEADNSAL